MNSPESGQSSQKSTLKRRTLVAGTAWAVPVVATAAPARAFTASGPVTAAGCAGKLPGSSCPGFAQGYRFYFTATNPPGFNACVKIIGVRIGAGPVHGPAEFRVVVPTGTGCAGVGTGCCSGGDDSLSVPQGVSATFAIEVLDASNSANTTMSIDYEVRNSGTCELIGTFTAQTPVLTTPSPSGDCNAFPIPTHYGCTNLSAPFCR